MRAMVQITQVQVLDYPIAPCQKCKKPHRFCEMFELSQLVSSGRVCRDCWDAYKEKSRKVTAARYAKDKQMELVA